MSYHSYKPRVVAFGIVRITNTERESQSFAKVLRGESKTSIEATEDDGIRVWLYSPLAQLDISQIYKPLIVAPVRRQYYPALEGLRGIAVLMILIHHILQIDPARNSVHEFVRGGTMYLWSGVDLFFVLSGFLIFGILIDHAGTPAYFRTFYGRRTLRIFPLYFGLLILSFYVFPYIGFDPQVASQNRWWFWTYTSNFFFIDTQWWATRYFNHLWSLAIEEQFYLVAPLVIFLIRDPAKLVRTIPYLVVFLTVLRLVLFLTDTPFSTLYLNTLTRTDGLLLGGWLAALIRLPDKRLRIRVSWPQASLGLAFGIGAMILASLSFDSLPMRYALPNAVLVFPALALIFLACVAFCISDESNPLQKICAHPVLQKLGKISYGVYILHVPVAFGCLDVLKHYGIASQNMSLSREIFVDSAMAALAIIAATMSWHLYEKQFLRLKSKLPYKSRRNKIATAV